MTTRAIAGCLFAAGAAALGQPFSVEPEVRRALPVNAPSQLRMNRVEPAIPVSAASPGPAVTPAPSPASTPGEPFRPPQRRAENGPASPTDEEGSIRIAPAGAPSNRNEALELANSLYARKMYDLAVPEYERFLISSSGSEGRDTALFRLAECHRMVGNPTAARAGYEKLVMEFQKGEFAGAGAYRLGEFLFGDKLYDAAYAQFQTAAQESQDSEVRLTALYFSARSLDYLKNEAGARAGYEAVLAVKGKNPYRDHARMASADIDVRNGKKEQALAAYEEIAGQPGNAPMAVEAAVKAALVASELGKNERALELFNKVLSSAGAGDWKSVAVIGAMRLRYKASDYRGVVGMAGAAEGLPAAARQEALQLLAASHRQTGNNLDARKTYDLLLKEFPDAQGDSRFQRLVSLYALKDKNLVAEIDAFLEKTTNPKERIQALLLKAETLFKQGDYAGAGRVYEGLGASDLSGEVRADALYKMAWCLAATGKHPEAAAAYSDFLSKFPDHKLAPTALAQRALSQEANKAFESAMKDFDAIAAKYPGTKEQELALQHKALIFGQQKKYPEMARTFDRLLAEFPKTAAAGQANFWLGWAAFEQKDYQGALAKLESARSLDVAQYGDRATLRIILAHYYLEDRDAVAREAQGYKGGNIPSEISLWLASKYVDEGGYAKAEALLLPLTANPAALPPDAWIQLAECQIRLGKFREALGPAEKFLASARDPATRARALLASARIRLGLKQFPAAAAAADEALLLQPEGRLNAEGRLLLGDILFAQSDHEGAARAYMTVAVLLEDPSITPRALQKAAEAYQRANNRFESEKALAELHQKYPDFSKSAQPSKTKP
ncbi:MAG: tetratricopeptide repeat protein [Verrucomicrobiae bacterium]